MGSLEYITQQNNGEAFINCSKLPDKVFIDATKTKQIAKAKILSPQEKMSNTMYNPGGPDVLIQYATGEKKLITRREFSKNYVHSSGNKIIIPFLKNSKQYLVYNICNEQYKIIKLPDNCSAILPNNRKTNKGDYIIAKADDNGIIDKNSITSMKSNVFRKMFKVPMQPVIKVNMRNKPNSNNEGKIFKLFNKKSKKNITRNINTRPKFNSSEIGMNPSNINIKSINDINNTNNIDTQQEKKMWKPEFNRATIQNNQNKQNNQNNQNITTYKFRVTSKIIDMNGKVLGFVVQDIKTGKTKNLKTNELTQLCMNKLVENVMVVRNQRGNIYLKGNGCSLEHLPQVIA